MKEWLYQATMKVAKQTDSSVLQANAWHHRVDALSAIVALVGVSGRFIGLPWLDPVGGAAVGAVVLKTGCEVGLKSLKELVDLSVDDKTLDLIRHEAVESIPASLQKQISVVDVIARKAGPHLHSVVKIEISKDVSIDQLFETKHEIEHHIMDIHHMQSVVVNITQSPSSSFLVSLKKHIIK